MKGIAMIKVLMLTYVVTGLMLMLVSFLMYQLGLEEGQVSVAVMIVYFLAGLLAGFLSGRTWKNKKYLWGMAAGLLYFVILAAASLIVHGGWTGDPGAAMLCGALCIGGGALGGMLG